MRHSRSPFKRGESEWISISDLMAGLMMIFLFIAISYMHSVQLERDQIKRIAVAYRQLQEDLYSKLMEEFRDDLLKWNAHIDEKTLSVRFQEPDVLFAQGSHAVTERFQAILLDFFPRYLDIMYSDEYRSSIEEIRIEGHTSSEWTREVSSEQAYFLNMKLSQDRTRAVLEHCLHLVDEPDTKQWARRYITANGLSSSRLVTDPPSGEENRRRSRRVEFRTKTAAEEKVVEILRELKDDA